MSIRKWPAGENQDYGGHTVPIPQDDGGGGGGIETKDEGSTVDALASVLDFVGAGVTATGGFGTTTITIPGGGGVDIEDEGTPVATATTIDFVGGNVAATDDGGGHVTVTVTGGSGLVINTLSADYTFVMADANEGFLHPTSDATARNWTIPSDASVGFPVGTTLTFINETGGTNFITISITSDTLTLGGTPLTGTRTIQLNGVATALKTDSTDWIINGSALS